MRRGKEPALLSRGIGNLAWDFLSSGFFQWFLKKEREVAGPQPLFLTLLPANCDDGRFSWCASLELKFQSNLGNSPRLRFEDLPKSGVVTVAVDRARAIELSMVEGVEGLETKFE